MTDRAVSRRPSAATCLYVYAAAWTVVLLAYQQSWMAYYAPLETGLATFIIITIVCAVAIAELVRRRDSDGPPRVVGDGEGVHEGAEAPSSRALLIASVIVAIGFALDFLYEGSIPLLVEFTRGYEHGSFQGIPTLHVLLVTGTTFLIVFRADLAMISTGAARRGHICNALALLTLLFLLVNRGVIAVCLLAWAAAYLMRRSFNRLRSVVAAVALATVALYMFGGLGNLRWGEFGDSDYIREIASVTPDFPGWLPGEYLWAYVYIVSPTGNLSYAMESTPPEWDYLAYSLTLLPDFITNRIDFQFSDALPRPVEYFNVATMYAGGWQYAGYVGMSVSFLALVALVLVTRALTRPPYQATAFALVSVICALSIFTNTLAFSGISFALIFPIVASLYPSAAARWRKRAFVLPSGWSWRRRVGAGTTVSPARRWRRRD